MLVKPHAWRERHFAIREMSFTADPCSQCGVTNMTWNREKWSHTYVTLIAYILCRLMINRFCLLIFGTQVKKTILHFVQQTGIVRFF